MTEPCCTATTRRGRPCAARPLPGSPFCLFHDPARQHALAQSLRKGGATPRRRPRRSPLLLASTPARPRTPTTPPPPPSTCPRRRLLRGARPPLPHAPGGRRRLANRLLRRPRFRPPRARLVPPQRPLGTALVPRRRTGR